MKSLIGVRIKSLRKSLNISQEDLSCSIMTRTILSKIENNKVIPSIYQLNYLSKALGVTMEYFIDEEPDILLNESNENTSLSIKYLYNQEKFYSIITYYEKSLIDVNKNINNLFYIGISYYKTEYYEEAKKFIFKFIKEFEKLHLTEKKYYVENYAFALNILSLISIKDNNFKKAITYTIKAKNILESYSLKHLRLYYVLMNNLSGLYNQTNNFKKSIKDLESFLDDLPEVVNLKMVASIHMNLNICYYNVNNYKKSLEHIKIAINLFNYSKNLTHAKGCYLNYINSLRYDKDYSKALDILEEFNNKYSKDLEENLKKEFSIQNIIIHFNMEDYDSVIKLMSNINYVKLEIYNRACFFFMKGHINFVKGNYCEAKDNLLSCFKFFSESTYIHDLKVIYDDLYKITGDEKYSSYSFVELYGKTVPRKNIVVI